MRSCNNSKPMIYIFDQKNASSNKRRLSIWDWSYKKGKSTWILARWKQSAPGPHPRAFEKYEAFLGLQISTVDLSRISQKLPDPSMI